MNNKPFLLFLLLTPIVVIVASTLAFRLGWGPEETKNNGEFFKVYQDISKVNLFDSEDNLLSFNDGKWVMGVYHSNESQTLENLRLMKQLNIALNREIYRVRRVAFFNNVDDSGMREVLENDFPRVEIFEDREKQLHFMLDKLGSEEIVNRSYIFVVDPYGRMVMFFPNGLNPKMILKDLKVLT